MEPRISTFGFERFSGVSWMVLAGPVGMRTRSSAEVKCSPFLAHFE
jgi:hypothetical protein